MYVKYLSQYLGQASNDEHENYLACRKIHWLTWQPSPDENEKDFFYFSERNSCTDTFWKTFKIFIYKIYQNVLSSLAIDQLFKKLIKNSK